jgi:hypothetical protein
MITPRGLMDKVKVRKLELDNQFEQTYLDQKDAMELLLEELLVDAIARNGRGVWIDEYGNSSLYNFLVKYSDRIDGYSFEIDDVTCDMYVTPILDDDSWNEY